MAIPLNLIKKAANVGAKIQKQAAIVNTNLITLAEQQNVTADILVENITHILAGVAYDAEQGKTIRVMHLKSIADFLAGVEAIAIALPTSTDQKKKQNTLRILAAASIGSDGHVNDAVLPIIHLGARKSNLHDKYFKIIQDYTDGAIRGEAENRQLLSTVRKLQLMIDQATRIAMHSSKMNDVVGAGPSMQGSTPSHL